MELNGSNSTDFNGDHVQTVRSSRAYGKLFRNVVFLKQSMQNLKIFCHDCNCLVTLWFSNDSS